MWGKEGGGGGCRLKKSVKSKRERRRGVKNLNKKYIINERYLNLNISSIALHALH